MKFTVLAHNKGTALMGLFLIIFGCVGLVAAQGEAVPRVVQVGMAGPYLGITMEDVTADATTRLKLAAETGVIVRTVEKGSPAESARIQENDVILEYAGMPVISVASLTRMVRETPIGRTVNLVVSRDGKKTGISVKIGERKGAFAVDRFEVLPRRLQIPQWDVQPGGTGTFQFRSPEGRNNIFRVFPAPGNAVRTKLGITVQTLTEQMAAFLGVASKQGVLVTSVDAGSPATASLKAGDVITAVDGKTIIEPLELSQTLAKKEPGSKVELKVVRDKKEILVTIDLKAPGAVSRGVKV